MVWFESTSNEAIITSTEMRGSLISPPRVHDPVVVCLQRHPADVAQYSVYSIHKVGFPVGC